jgi:hypothetical protein
MLPPTRCAVQDAREEAVNATVDLVSRLKLAKLYKANLAAGA